MPTAGSRFDHRKRPSQARSAETIGAILEAAARILEERGFERYTTNGIAEVAGISVGSLYQYFPNKDAITMALIDRETAVFVEQIDAASRKACWREALVQMIRAAVAQQLSRPRLARLLDVAERGLPMSDHRARAIETVHAALRRVLEMEPRFTALDLQTAVEDLMAMTRGLIDAAGDRGEDDIDSLETRTRAAVFGYVDSAFAGETPLSHRP